MAEKVGDATSESSILWDSTGPAACRPWTASMGPTKCTPVALGFMGSEKGSKLGPVVTEA